MKIKTNNQPRLLSYWCDVPEKVKKDQFDYLTNEEAQGRDFVQYKGLWYDLGEFMRVSEGGALDNLGWQGVEGHSYFHGVLVKYDEFDNDMVIMGIYFE